jgi:hypothetical protein
VAAGNLLASGQFLVAERRAKRALLAFFAHGSRGVKVARGAALFVAYLNRLLNFAEPAAKYLSKNYSVYLGPARGC